MDWIQIAFPDSILESCQLMRQDQDDESTCTVTPREEILPPGKVHGMLKWKKKSTGDL